MGQPEWVPVSDRDRVHVSERLPPPSRWSPGRPGDVKDAGGQPGGPMLGSAGPDQGYALRLARLISDRLRMVPGEHLEDVIAGAVEVAMKRASLFGRAPVRADVEVAVTLWGFLGDPPDDELVVLRREMFAQASHHYDARRSIVDQVPSSTLLLSLADVQAGMRTDWRALLGVPQPV
jgi:hypothetical protein